MIVVYGGSATGETQGRHPFVWQQIIKARVSHKLGQAGVGLTVGTQFFGKAGHPGGHYKSHLGQEGAVRLNARQSQFAKLLAVASIDCSLILAHVFGKPDQERAFVCNGAGRRR